MRQPILNRNKTYGRGKKSQTKPNNLSVEAARVDMPAPALAKRLDKHETIELAKETLRQICVSQEAPSNARATAARTLLELVGALGRHSDPTSMNTIPASEMSLEQLEARIASLITH